MSSQTKAIKRLLSDLKQLENEPIIGANARPFNENLMTWYGIVMRSPNSKYEGIPIRFVLEFDDQYPNNPPKAFFDTDVPYTEGARMIVNGRQAVCLNIFGNFGHVHTEWKNMSEGWSPSYTVSTILIAMQGLMIGDMLSNNDKDIENMRKSAFNFKCNVTGHEGSCKEKWFPYVFLSQEEINNYFNLKGISQERQKYDIYRDFYICYAKKCSMIDGAILGYGINVEKNKMMNSPCEYLSLDAFNDGINRSSTNKQFDFWLPILVNSSNWTSIKTLFFEKIRDINKSAGLGCKNDSEIVLKIFSSIMNNLVVEIMNNKNNLTANDKFINGYFTFYRLMKQFAQDDKTIVNNANKYLENFIKNPGSRTKNITPNLGDFLIYLTISDRYEWKDIAKYFIEECDARNVFWYLIGTRYNPAKCPQLKNPEAKDRSKLVYGATEVSRNIVMFQVRFSQVAKSINLETFDLNHGLAPEKLRYELKNIYNEIIKMKSWENYFKWLNMPSPSVPERDKQLLEAMKLSAKNGYHKL